MSFQASSLGYASFFSHLEHIHEPDRGRIPHVPLTIVIGAGWAIDIAALVASLRALPEGRSATTGG